MNLEVSSDGRYPGFPLPPYGKSRLTDPWPVVLCFSKRFPYVLVPRGGRYCTSNQKNRSGVIVVEVKIMKFLALWNIENPQPNAQLTDHLLS